MIGTPLAPMIVRAEHVRRNRCLIGQKGERAGKQLYAKATQRIDLGTAFTANSQDEERRHNGKAKQYNEEEKWS